MVPWCCAFASESCTSPTARRTPSSRQARMVAYRSGARTEDEPLEATGLGEPRLGAQSQDAGTGLLDSMYGQRRSETFAEAARREPSRNERLHQQPENAEETVGSRILRSLTHWLE